jgi:hypothetical protein
MNAFLRWRRRVNYHGGMTGKIAKLEASRKAAGRWASDARSSDAAWPPWRAG